MANISIDFDPSKNEIYLLGDIKALQKHRFAWRYARDYLNPTVEAERIVIPVGDNEPYAVMSNISSMLAKYGFIEDQSKSTEQVVMGGGGAIWGTPPLKTVTFGLSVNF